MDIYFYFGLSPNPSLFVLLLKWLVLWKILQLASVIFDIIRVYVFVSVCVFMTLEDVNHFSK